MGCEGERGRGDLLDSVQFIGRGLARTLVERCHYSRVMPRITKLCIGGFAQGGRLVAVMTLGYGTRPLHTLRLLFPSLTVPEYLEIGKLCVDDGMPPNTESYFIARCIGLLRKHYPQVKVLFSWADGILGKPGFVYQASNFYYGGYTWSEMYLDKNGVRVHPRTIQGITARPGLARGPRDFETTKALGYTKYYGKQFRYVYPLCSRREWKRLQAESPFEWRRGEYPKDEDCTWKVQVALGVAEECGPPPFVRGDYVKQRGKTGQLRLL